jgi:hypothetical protein
MSLTLPVLPQGAVQPLLPSRKWVLGLSPHLPPSGLNENGSEIVAQTKGGVSMRSAPPEIGYFWNWILIEITGEKWRNSPKGVEQLMQRLLG